VTSSAQLPGSGRTSTLLVRNSTRRPVGLPVAPAALLTRKDKVLRPATKPPADAKLLKALKLPPEPVIWVVLRKIETRPLSLATRPVNLPVLAIDFGVRVNCSW